MTNTYTNDKNAWQNVPSPGKQQWQNGHCVPQLPSHAMPKMCCVEMCCMEIVAVGLLCMICTSPSITSWVCVRELAFNCGHIAVEVHSSAGYSTAEIALSAS